MIKRDAHELDEVSKERLGRHVQKIVNAAHTSFSKNSLLEERMEFLTTINNEAKVRRSARSIMLGKAKVMSYEDLEEARAKRAAKDLAKAANKGRRCRKRKSAETDGETDPSEKVKEAWSKA
jgi:hypothetical protein